MNKFNNLYNQIICEQDELSSLSDADLLKAYKDAFDKQFTEGGKDTANKYYTEIKKRGGKTLIQANNYADHKRNLER
jgi:uncharacterized protein